MTYLSVRAVNRPVLALFLCLLFGASASAYVAILNKADNTVVHIVPAPGPVAIDGDLADWDLSGTILMFLAEASKATHALQASMMYDAEHLYISGRWKDPTPMMNQCHFGGQVNDSWNADAIQLRFVSNPAVQSAASTNTGAHMPAEEQNFVNHITLWYSTRDNAAGYYACYTLGYKDAVLNPAGVRGAWVKDEDGAGCTFEYAIPWKVLRAPRPLTGGDTVQTQFQVHWGNDKGTGVRAGLTDVRNPTSNDLGYMGPSSWGKGIFEKEGHLELAAAKVLERARGHIAIPFTLKRDSKVSINIVGAKGLSVRTGIGAVPYEAGEHVWHWDGLDDRDRPLPAGTYTARILTHDGIGQKYVCNVGVSGAPPYQTEDGTGGWAGDYWEPMYVAIAGERVILGTGCAEAQKPTICTDLAGRKQYGTAALGHSLAVHEGFGYFVAWAGSQKLIKFDLADGRLAPFAGGAARGAGPGAEEDSASRLGRPR